MSLPPMYPLAPVTRQIGASPLVFTGSGRPSVISVIANYDCPNIITGTLLFTGTQVSMEERLAELAVPSAQSVLIVDAVVDSAGSVIPGLTEGLVSQQFPQALAEDISTAAGEAFTDGAKWAAWSAAGFLLLGFASTFYLGSQRTKTKSKGSKKS
jgi:hypothetical protein